ncbi:uncharacterized protein LY79DRAFT_568769 [Colletotrichum navitas]|uniref:Uncharacterized protein n=1 Tax=Colletotrichum navitas TaxID=681940 RepID=A0AAD8UZ90_9PEZI|nr:uncharacterized protein LY79DRAFT_568769 [Colletotrichum navitas]KAK1573402.1 hypothetical protein LY79DRAFT_568769 [Colletotrichum navitas]
MGLAIIASGFVNGDDASLPVSERRTNKHEQNKRTPALCSVQCPLSTRMDGADARQMTHPFSPRRIILADSRFLSVSVQPDFRADGHDRTQISSLLVRHGVGLLVKKRNRATQALRTYDTTPLRERKEAKKPCRVSCLSRARRERSRVLIEPSADSPTQRRDQGPAPQNATRRRDNGQSSPAFPRLLMSANS